MFEIRLKCPVCSFQGLLGNKKIFEPMSMREGDPVVDCPKCGSRIAYSMPFSRRIIGKPKIKRVITVEQTL